MVMSSPMFQKEGKKGKRKKGGSTNRKRFLRPNLRRVRKERRGGKKTAILAAIPPRRKEERGEKGKSTILSRDCLPKGKGEKKREGKGGRIVANLLDLSPRKKKKGEEEIEEESPTHSLMSVGLRGERKVKRPLPRGERKRGEGAYDKYL